MAGTLLVLGIPALAIRTLHGLAGKPWLSIDYRDPGRWLATTPLADALASLARLGALALSYYLLIATALYLLAVASGRQTITRVLQPFVPGIVRSLADRIVAGSIAIGTLATPLLASSPPPPPTTHVIGDYLPAARDRLAPPPPAPSFEARPTTAPATEVPAAPRPLDSTPTGVAQIRPGEVTVEEGDHLWGLAERVLTDSLGRRPTDPEVAPYWRELVEVNRHRLRSGDPDLIYPGEVLTLPDPAPFIPGGS